MSRLSWLIHPITVFVALQIVWLAITFIWVTWFVGIQEEIAAQMRKFGREYFDSGTTVAILVVGCVLLSALLFGTIALFVFGQRQSALARQQCTFVSSVTHELKSPLASLQLSIETIGAHQLNDEQKARIMNMATTDLERLRRLVDQILIAGSLDRGILIFDEERQAVAFQPLITKIADNLSYLDPHLRLRLDIECAEGFTVQASRSALMLILHNLIENAVKYSPRDKPIIISVEQNGGEVFMFVRDLGLGLEKKDLRRVFRMFHRSDSAIRKAIPGTGLGLYIVRSAVRVLGGRVWAESAGRDKGATFYVSLPLGSRYLSAVT